MRNLVLMNVHFRRLSSQSRTMTLVFVRYPIPFKTRDVMESEIRKCSS